jgi:translocation and assembly module TamB
METPMEGFLDFGGHMTGPPSDPAISGSFSGDALRFGDFSLERVVSTFGYGGERIDLELSAFDRGNQVLAASGFFPSDLRVQPDGARIPNAPIGLDVSFESFPADIGLAFMDAIEEVEGALTGDLHFAGTTGDLEPRGDLVLVGGAATVPALGVRHRNVQAHLLLSTDGIIRVDGSLQSGGNATVSGTVRLRDPLSDPGLNLKVEVQEFLAVARRDFQGTLSGFVDVTKTYKSPLVKGELTVEEGVLMVEEVARSVEVVDLSDPTFFNPIDTPLALRPIIRSNQNPFLQNLMLDVQLTMAQDSWLRGREMNLELEGNLGVYWDRTQRDLAFLGVLNAVRGVYSVFGRQFQVEEGTVSFPGTPGINPDLNIRALNRLRTANDDRLEIIATVDGSLLAPRVSLSSNSTFQIAESDLVSYLIFGRPSYALASGQSAVVRGAAGVFAGATASLAFGLFSSELGAVLTRDWGLDYLAVSQGQNQALNTKFLGGTVATTQVEIGQYLTDDLFASVLWRPLSSGTGQDEFAALRIESRLSDRWTLEGYWEDRFLRSGIWGFEDQDLDLSKVFGFFLYREWGY